MTRALAAFCAIGLACAALPAAAAEPSCGTADAECRAFSEASKAPARGGPKTLVFIGSAAYRLTAWEAERERRCLALVGWAEARNDGADGMSAAMWSIANRAADGLHPSSPCDVVAAKGQYEPMAKRAAPKKGAKHARHAAHADSDGDLPPKEAVKRILAHMSVQRRVISQGGMPEWPKTWTASDKRTLRVAKIVAWRVDSELSGDPTRGATMFYAPDTQAKLGRKAPDWADPKKLTAVVGGHRFYLSPASKGVGGLPQWAMDGRSSPPTLAETAEEKVAGAADRLASLASGFAGTLHGLFNLLSSSF